MIAAKYNPPGLTIQLGHFDWAGQGEFKPLGQLQLSAPKQTSVPIELLRLFGRNLAIRELKTIQQPSLCFTFCDINWRVHHLIRECSFSVNLGDEFMVAIHSLLIGFMLIILTGCMSTTAPNSTSAPKVIVSFENRASYTISNEERGAIENITEMTVRELSLILPGIPENVELVITTGEQVIPETGSSGVALAPGKISWVVDPNYEGGVERNARRTLRTTLFHEYHHLVRGWTFEGGTAGTRMIDAAVAEGLATTFERDAASSNPLWGQYDPEIMPGWIEELLQEPDMRNYQMWMLDHPDGRRWIGYRAGTYIVDQAIMATGKSAAELAAVPTDTIMSMAGIDGRQQRDMMPQH